MNKRQVSQRQEERVAEILGGRRVLNSGATPLRKGDVRDRGRILCECKTTERPQKSQKIDKAWLDKVEGESLSMGIDWACLAIDFGDVRKQYFVVPESMMRYLLSCVEATEGNED